MKIVVLGAFGMLGSMVVGCLSRIPSLKVFATVRNQDSLAKIHDHLPEIEISILDAESCGINEIAAILSGAQWAINCVGVIKSYIHDDNAAEIYRAIRVNSLFPHLLARAAEATDCHVLQIATDCVYSGVKGRYSENDPHDPLDGYGKTKSLGEVPSQKVHHLRCSIVGPEPKGHISLRDWFLQQPRDSVVNGYVNHQWNGVTTLHFGRLCEGIIKNGMALPQLQHVVPCGRVSKAELLECFAREYDRRDIRIMPVAAKVSIDRTLATVNSDFNHRLWAAAGYPQPPAVPDMVAELSEFNHRLLGSCS